MTNAKGQLAHVNRLSVGMKVSGYEGQFGHFEGVIVKYVRMPCVRRNLPDMWLATIVVNEFGSEVVVNYDKLNEAYA